MSMGWICPKCGRALAPWVSECPCYLDKAVITTNSTAVWGNVNAGRCDKVCDNKTDFGYCRSTGCINPIYSGSGDVSVYDKAAYDRMRMAEDPDYGRGNNA